MDDESELYTPPDIENLSPEKVAEEIDLVQILESTHTSEQPLMHVHYAMVLDKLYARREELNSQTSAYPTPGEGSASGSNTVRQKELNSPILAYSTPGESSASGSTAAYSNSLKRGRDSLTSGEPSGAVIPTQYSSSHSLPNCPNGSGYNINRPYSVPKYMNTGEQDPFPELNNAFRSDRRQPADASNQIYVGAEDLAELLTETAFTPGFTPRGYAADPTVNLLAGSAYSSLRDSPNRNAELEQEIFGDNWDLFHEEDNPEAVQDLIDNIKFDQEVEPEAREQTPATMSATLMEHQKIALTWLLKMERSSTKGGILADEMGLGKTVQALALILANPSSDEACKTTLIVAPVALMRQWEKEIERHVKPHHRLKVHIYHSTKGKNATFDKLRKYDVVLTTYGTLASELKQKDNRKKQDEARAEDGQPVKRRGNTQMLSLVGRECKWYRVILDEAQCIKNRKTLTSRAAHDLVSLYRWCLTGTPMQNNVDELFSLIRFLKVAPYSSWNKFNFEISRMLKNKHEHTQKTGMDRVQAILKSIMLRRCKTSLVDGKQICEIPPKKNIEQSVKFSDAELQLYKAIETKSQVQFNKYLAKGTVNNNYANVLVMLLRLRQICCHPHLVKDLGVQVSTDGIAEDALNERAKVLSQDVVRRLQATESFECPICFEVEWNPTIFIPCGHTCCGECFEKLKSNALASHEGNDPAGAAKCPHCRAILSSDNITDYKHFCKVHCPEKLPQFGEEDVQAEGSDVDVDDDSDDDSGEDLDDDEVDDRGNLADFVVDDESDGSETVEDGSRNKSKGKGKGKARKAEGKGKGKAKAKPILSLAQLKKESLKSKSAKRKYLRRLRKNFESSAKIDQTIEILTKIKANDPTEKTLIFSQFTSLLDLLEVPMSEHDIKYQRYDGSMSMNDRADAVNNFMDDPTQNVFLISLKAGNAGLNLNTASQVIMMDPFWNPFVEDQAVDRAHRMPQKREVQVHRLLVAETVEDRICELQNRKRDLINTALDEGVGKSLTGLSVGELQFLFGLRGRPT